jgi:hypothetical protein
MLNGGPLLLALREYKHYATVSLPMPTMLVITVFWAVAGVALADVHALSLKLNAEEITTGTPLDGFVSYSIEFSSFPDFVGMLFSD